MRKYMFLLLLLVLAALCLFGCGRQQQNDKSDAAVHEGAADSSHLTPDQLAAANEIVSSLQYCDGQITFRFSLSEDGVWRWVDEPSFPLDGEKVVEFLTALQALSQLEELPLPADLGPYGLDDPQKYIILHSEALTGTIYIGDQAEDGSWYLLLEGADHFHMIPDEFMTLMRRSVYDMALLPTLPAFTEDNLLRVEVADDSRQVFLRKVGEEWKGTSEQVSDRAEEVLSTLSSLQVSRCFDYLPSQQALALTGFSAPTATITVDYLNSVAVETTFTLTLGALRSAEEGYYATISGDDTIYLLPSSSVSSLLVLLIYSK